MDGADGAQEGRRAGRGGCRRWRQRLAAEPASAVQAGVSCVYVRDRCCCAAAVGLTQQRVDRCSSVLLTSAQDTSGVVAALVVREAAGVDVG